MAHPDHRLVKGFPTGALLQGRYRLGRELGRGPVSITYLAHDHQQGDEVAIKALALAPAERARARHEVVAAWAVVHRNIVAVRGCFEAGECACVAMDYVDGPDLGTRILSGPLSAEEAAAVGRGVALGLQAAHRLGILHRHVVPSNILIGAEVRASLSDFGSAGFGAPRGNDRSRDLLAPEVAAGQPADARTDLYGLGLCLFISLTGQLPARPASDRSPTASADGFRPSWFCPTVPPWLDDAVAQATAVLPADRFSSAGRFAEALAQARSAALGR